MVARQFHDSYLGLIALYFISTETLEVFQRMSVMCNCKYEYDRGLLLQSSGNGLARILVVASGTYFNVVH